MDNSITSLTASALGITTLVAGLVGGQVISDTQIKDLNAQISIVQEQKQSLVDSYIYSQISSGRVPTVDTTNISLDEATQGYIDIVGTTTLPQKDLFKQGEDIAKAKGDFICGTPN